MSAKFMVPAAKAGESPPSTEADMLANASCRASRLESLLLKCIFTSRYITGPSAVVLHDPSRATTQIAPESRPCEGRVWCYCAGGELHNRACSEPFCP